jgi:asparagine synthase (glutamine-hydrolysing)
MCGICGAMAIGGGLDPRLRAALPAMTRALQHRGPDGEGFFADDYAMLGHRRLSIIDRAGGGQPLANEDQTCWVTFNGEIYNHRSLRKVLEDRGHVFRTGSDTEVIVHAWEEYGSGCVDHLEGMFAFGVYDARRRTLFLARDRVGKKPLFYAMLGGTLHFASEIKAFYRSPFWDDTPDLSGLEGYLSLGYILAPHTIYRHVRKLEPGHWLQMRNDRIEIRKYWDVTAFDDDRREHPELMSELDGLLRSQVTDRLESEVPLGAFLSGGVDSGLVVSYMAESPGRDVVTTSAGFGDPRHNELDAAALTANRFGTRHYASLLEPQLDVLDTIASAFDEPFADSSAIPTYYVAAAARRHVTVALSGDGGDEVFGGYDFRYQPHALEERIRRFIPAGAGPALRWAGARWPRSRRLPKPLRLGTIFDNLGGDAARAYYNDLCFLKPDDTGRLLGRGGARDLLDSPTYHAVTDPYRRCPSNDPVQRAQYADFKTYLPNDVLVKVDRMSMQHGLEVRCPLLDRRIVEYGFRIPQHRKMPRLAPKHLLRQLAAERLPKELAGLPKHGFTAPVSHWLAGPAAEQFRADVLGPASASAAFFDTRHIGRLFDEHRTAQRDHSYALWAVWMFERWKRTTSSRKPAAETLPTSVPEPCLG